MSSGLYFAQRFAEQLGKIPIRLDSPSPQPFYHYIKDKWEPIHNVDGKDENQTPPDQPTQISKIRLTTWNIDFSALHAQERMAGALCYLSQLHEPSDIPVVIFLQEMKEEDLEQIQAMQWIRDRFFITDISDQFWKGWYGTTTLVDRQLSVQRVFRIPYASSKMQRDALFADVSINQKTLRLCNTHLESLLSNPPRRPIQLNLASQYMHGSNPTSHDIHLPTPHASILAGDLNAFAAEDRTVPDDCGLRDAFLVTGGQEDTEESFTWGQQIPAADREKFGCSRMDKILFCGDVAVENFRRIGEGETVRVDVPEEFWDEGKDGKEVWVTDHLGLQADFAILNAV